MKQTFLVLSAELFNFFEKLAFDDVEIITDRHSFLGHIQTQATFSIYLSNYSNITTKRPVQTFVICCYYRYGNFNF